MIHGHAEFFRTLIIAPDAQVTFGVVQDDAQDFLLGGIDVKQVGVGEQVALQHPFTSRIRFDLRDKGVIGKKTGLAHHRVKQVGVKAHAGVQHFLFHLLVGHPLDEDNADRLRLVGQDDHYFVVTHALEQVMCAVLVLSIKSIEF